ncbi:MAG: tRNA (guanosine(37)-N1)-methyltransferase TrmD [Enterocloster sp.]
MNFHILTLFPDMVMGGLGTSITGRAMDKGTISVEAIDIRDYSKDKHRHVDDTPYGGGAGMVMQPGPVCDAYEDLCCRLGKRPRVIYMTPQGKVFNQSIAQELAQEEELVFLCGHYEGIDERALELIATDYLSVGDYVLTGGELPAMVMIDCISRLVPGVLNNEVSAEVESFHDNLLEYPQYTRPEVYKDKAVPDVLLTGHHKNIEAWRREQSIRRTLERRPDLLKEAVLTLKEQKFLDSLRGTEEGLGELEQLIDGYVRELDCPASSARIRRRAMASVKKLMASGECALSDIKGYYKVCRLKLRLWKNRQQ